MYSVDASSPVKLNHSPSFLLSNLSSSPMDTISYVHLNEVFIESLAGDSHKLSLEKAKIYQSSFVEVQGKCALAVLTNRGAQLWSASGQDILFQFELSAVFGNVDEIEGRFARGVCSFDDYFCIGCSSGEVFVFSSKSGADFPLHCQLAVGEGAVTVLSSAADLLVAGTDCGDLYGFSCRDSFKRVFTFPGKGAPCTAIGLTNEWLIVGYSTGHIRVFRLDIMELSFEVTAHTRAITGIAMNNTHTWFASCGKDQFVHVWSVPDVDFRTSSGINLLSSEVLENKLCTGITFLTDDRLCVASFDDEELVIMSK